MISTMHSDIQTFRHLSPVRWLGIAWAGIHISSSHSKCRPDVTCHSHSSRQALFLAYCSAIFHARRFRSLSCSCDLANSHKFKEWRSKVPIKLLLHNHFLYSVDSEHQHIISSPFYRLSVPTSFLEAWALSKVNAPVLGMGTVLSRCFVPH